MLIQAPGFTAVALLTIALGIAANTTIFSLVNSILLQPLPYPNPERLVQVGDIYPATGTIITSSLPKFTFIRDHARSFSAFTAVTDRRFQVNGPAPALPAEIFGARVSSDFFSVFGVNPASGRTFERAEDQPGAPPVVVISEKLWRIRFGADPNVIGKNIGVNGASTTIIGIMPAGFDYPDGTEIWIPRIFEHSVITPVQIQRGASYMIFYARLADGVAAQTAQAEMDLLSRQYDAAHAGFGDVGRGMRILPLRETIVGDSRRLLLVVFGAVGFVLLIACANVANLLLARAIARQKEVAVRVSLGASRLRLFVQFLTESLLLASLGGTLGLLISLWATRLIRGIGPDILPRANEVHIDLRVLLFTAALAMLSSILFGLGPALHSARLDLNEALKATGRGIAAGSKLRAVMMTCEVALAMILLSGAGLLMRSFLRLANVDPGFRPDHLVTMRVSLAAARYPSRPQQVEFYDRVLDRLASLPGVRNASLASALPVNGRTLAYFFNVDGRPPLDPSKAPTAWMHSISPNYFETLGIPFLAGRAFNAADNAGAMPVAIVNQTMARRFWPDENPVGNHFTYAREAISVQIVGVSADVKIGGLGNTGPDNLFYVPYRQRPFLGATIIARGPESLVSAAPREILAIDPDEPVSDIRTMEQAISDSISQPRLRTAVIGAFALLAVLLAAIGIAGMVAWSVSQRTAEIGIRMALGARPSNILGMVLRQAFAIVGAGQLLGLAGALALTRVLSSFLFGISPEDTLTFVSVLVLLGGIALAASMIAARRALSVDPVIALRIE